MISISPDDLELDPLEIDPRQCELCGLTVDRHEMVDDGDGPIFYCPEFDVDDDGDDIVRRWELADPRDRWKHTGEPPPPASVRNSDIAAKPNAPRSYRAPRATVDAFWYVVGLCDPERLRVWLQNHPQDARHLLKLLESK